MKIIEFIHLAIFLLIALLLILPVSIAASHQKSNLLILIDNVSSKSGNLFVSITDKAADFATEIGQITRKVIKASKAGKNLIAISDLAYGTYAVTIFHDVNGNEKLDKNILGIPKEGYGFSNNARATFGPPSFDQAKFKVSDHQTKIEITMKY